MARVLLLSGAAVMAVVTACSSSGGGGYGGGGGGGSSQAPSSSAKAAAAGAVTISMSGSTLTGPDGHTLYTNTVDTVSNIKCVGACASEWPPVTGTPKAGTGVDGAKLGTATRPDGTKQVTLDGHPLYEFDEDKAPGDKHGDGLADEGGTWHVATLAGAGAPASAPSSGDNMGSSGSGYHY
jgi:predicted lipoprotein with Yx(FWY)xxD motif